MWRVTADYSTLLDEDVEHVEEIKVKLEGYKKDLEDARRRLEDAPTIEAEREAWNDIDDLAMIIDALQDELKWST